MARKKEDSRQCRACGGSIPLSRTQCPSCKTFDIDTVAGKVGQDGIVRMSAMSEAVYPNRIATGPWDLNFGTHYDDDGKGFSGLVDTTITLLGGKNGSGKSTLVMHLAKALIAASNVKTNPKCKEHPNCYRRDFLYISAEEGNNALRSRAKRLGLSLEDSWHLLVSPLGQKIELTDVIERYKPMALVGDSISKMVPDIDKAVDFCDNLRPLCEQFRMPAIIINHINKEGDQAGLEALQHSVDAVLLFTIDTDKVRIIETIKNRNGEDGVKTLYRMTGKGLVYDKKAMAELEDESGDEEDLDEDDEDDDDDDNEDYDDE